MDPDHVTVWGCVIFLNMNVMLRKESGRGAIYSLVTVVNIRSPRFGALPHHGSRLYSQHSHICVLIDSDLFSNHLGPFVNVPQTYRYKGICPVINNDVKSSSSPNS